MATDTLIYFNRWFVVPFEMLKQLNDGDGAFVSFSIGLALCERFHRIKTNTQDNWKAKSFLDDAAKHLNVDKILFEDFWDIFRNGIQHQASPKWRNGNNNKKPYKWAISADYKHIPILGTNNNGEDVICINPWSFTEYYIKLFLSDPELLNNAVQHSFGHIFNGNTISNYRQISYAAHPHTSTVPHPNS